MVSITCPCVECIYNGRGNKCRADKINLAYRNMATVNEGRVDMWICDKYTFNKESMQLLEAFERMMKERERRLQ